MKNIKSLAFINGELFSFEINPGTMETLNIEKANKNEIANHKIILISLFKLKDGSDHPLPRFIDPSFANFGFYRPLIIKEVEGGKK